MKKITIKDICKSYKQAGKQTEVLAGINIDITPGEFFFLLGPSGCGKTTLLRIITGLIEPSSGSILFDGIDVTSLDTRKRNASMVFQNYALWPHMTVQKNTEFGLEMKKIDRPTREQLAGEYLELVEMGQYRNRKPTQLSGGQQQRVALARALASKPDCLLLDEPLSNLDAKLRLQMRNELRSIVKKSNTTAIYVTHDQKEALAMADRIAIMHNGKIVQIGSPSDIYNKPASKFVADFIGESNFFDATIKTKNNITTYLDTDFGVIESEFINNLQTGQKVCCGIRPENIKLSTSKPPSQHIDVKVLSVSYLGEVTQITVVAKNQSRWKSFTISREASNLKPEMNIFMTLPSDSIMVFEG